MAQTQRTDPDYGHTAHLPGVGYADARARITAALKDEGFGILTEIDVKDTLKKKLDRDFRAYTILGACNPNLAHRALSAELGVGLLLPCNVCVWEEEGGSVVSIMRPDIMERVIDNPSIAGVVREADEKLRRALAKLQA